MTEYTCDSFRFFNLFPVYFGGKGTTGKITKNELRFSNLFVRQEFNFRAYFFFKNHKIQKNHFRFTPAYRGTPLSW